MSDSEDNWFDKDIDEFVVETKLAENVEDITLEEKRSQFNDLASADYGGSYSLPSSKKAPEKSVSKRSNKTAHVQPMPFRKICFLLEQTAIDAFMEVIHPESGLFECLCRKSNSLETIVSLSTLICKVLLVPFTENVKWLCENVVAEENYWSQMEKYLRDSTVISKKSKPKKKGQALPKDNAEIWKCVTELCQSMTDQKVRLPKSFLKNALQLAEKNENEDLHVAEYLQALKSVQDEQLRLRDDAGRCEIFPTLDELKQTDDVPLDPNIVHGKYRDVAHYLDVQLPLLREDFLQPLRDGVQQIMLKYGADEQARSNENVKVYPGVRIAVIEKDVPNRPGTKAECLVADLEALARNENTALGKFAQSKFSKRLMFGSLLLFTTTNQFDDLIVAIVSKRDDDLLARGYVEIEIVQTYNISSLLDKEFSMCESGVYFETYRHVYEVLRRFNEHTFPLRNYIIDVDVTPTYPNYIPETGRSIFIYKNQPLEMKDLSKWPTATQLGLNESQLNAFKSSLTRKFSVVQGPPGCGKTFIGLEIVATLLHNTDAQILIVCYTNHALDQFLTGLMKWTNDIVRIGNQSKNELLDQFNLKQLNENNMVDNKTLRSCLYALKNEYAATIQEFTELQVQLKQHAGDKTLMDKLLEVQAQLRSISRRQEELKQIGHYHLIKSKRVIGMTSTGAARCHSLIQLLQTPIVFIEEAAEILEPHIIASLTQSVQHLILIGDHQQLRPTSSAYKLSKLYKTDISLFERMINNNINCATLNEQYRMRPEIANLIRPTIYKTLLDSENVQKYPAVNGVAKNLFFLTHTHPESSDGDETTKKNKFEAKFLIGMCKYLISRGYSAQEITILTTYNGQMQQLFNERKQYDQLRKVRITVVDNFQGEDNKIILLSLVRSNTSNSVGYMAFKNRICVALSRAKVGLYVVGNMSLLAKNCKTWREIQTELESQEAIGDELSLSCSKQHVVKVQNAEDIDKFQRDGCGQPCNEALPCGHECRLSCHSKNLEHQCDC